MRRAYFTLLLGARGDMPAQVTYDRLVNALKEPQNWLTYWGDYTAVRHRDLKQINTANVKDLRVGVDFPDRGRAGAFETVPLVVDGIMYFTGGDGTAFALDARSGRQLWQYKHAFPAGHKAQRGESRLRHSRRPAVHGDADAHLVALDAATGTACSGIPRWRRTTRAPTTATHRAAGGEGQGDRRHLRRRVRHPRLHRRLRRQDRQARLAVLDRSRRRASRAAIPGPGDSWKRGGGPTWMTGTYDPKLNTLYWGVGNPGPDLYGDDRQGRQSLHGVRWSRSIPTPAS